MGKTKLEKSIDHRNEGFTARDAMYEHNTEKVKAVHRQIVTKTGLKMYTDKELESMGGPITEYNYNLPYTWHQFKAMPKINKREYLSHLRLKYKGISTIDLAKMFGVTNQSVLNACKEFGFIPFSTINYKSPEAKEAKKRFEAEMLTVVVEEEPVIEHVEQAPSYILSSVQFTCDAGDVSNILHMLGMDGMVTISAEVI